jgi:hypothetical protein
MRYLAIVMPDVGIKVMFFNKLMEIWPAHHSCLVRACDIRRASGTP